MRIKVKMNRIPELAKATPELRDACARAVGFALQEETVEQIRSMGAVDTGAMMNSVYLETHSMSERGAAVSAAATRAGAASKEFLEAIPSGRPGRGMSKLALAANYAVYVHQGARGRAARPFLMVAGQNISGQARQICAELVKEWVG